MPFDEGGKYAWLHREKLLASNRKDHERRLKKGIETGPFDPSQVGVEE